MHRFCTRSAIAVLIACLWSIPLMAQADRGTISGTVTDPSGAVVPGVDVKAVNVDTGVQTLSTTNEAGSYRLLNIPIGNYTITFSLTGFKTYERTAFRLTVGQAARLDVSLEIGQVTETVTVAANAEMIDTSNPAVSTTMQSKVITDLPLTFAGGRAVENFAYAITPGVEGNNWTSYLGGGQAFTKEVLIDGISATAQIQGHIGESSPTMEAVQEFKVETSGTPAEYGHTSGGSFNFALKSGTNKFSGSAFYYLRNEALNANTWMNNWNMSRCDTESCRDTYRRAMDRQNLYGFSAGGPVVIPKLYDGRDRTFIFGAFEQYEQQRLVLGAYNQTVPIPEFLQGNFSSLLTGQVVGQDALGRDVYAGQIFDPTTMHKTADGKWVSDPFQGNLIPENRFSSVSRQILDIYRTSYQPMKPGVINNSASTLYNDPWFHQSQLTLKGDHVFSPKNKLSGSFTWTQRPRILVGSPGIWDPTAGETGGPLAQSRKQEVSSRRATVSDNWTIRSNMINTFTFAFNRYRNPSLATTEGGGWPQKLGIEGTSSTQFPAIGFGRSINGIGITQIGYVKNDFYVGNTFIWSNGLSWIKGRHSMKFGGEYWYQQFNAHPAFEDVLNFGFSNTTTGIPGQPYSNNIGFGFASFLLGQVDSAGKAVTSDFYSRRGYLALYAQDDFKVSNKLTLNLGLRWEQTQPLAEKYNRWSNFNPNIENTALGIMGALEFASPEKRTFEGKRDWKEFSPRVGLAYRWTDKLVLRGSYGIFFTPIGMQYWFGIPYGNYGAHGYVGVDNVQSTGNLPRFSWDQGYPGYYQAPTKDPNFLTWGMVAIDPEALKAGYTQNFNVNAQYSLTPNDLVEVAYIGNFGSRLHDGGMRRNQPTRSVWENPNANPWAWVWDEGSAADAGVPYPYPGFSGQAGFALSPFPQVANTWGPIYYVESPLGSSSYHALQFQYTRRLSQGLAANLAYSFSRAKGNSEIGFQETWSDTGSMWWFNYSPGVQDIYNLQEAADTVTSFDQTHVFKGMASYQLPWGRGKKWLSGSSAWVDAILGGWTVTGIFRYSSGYPMAINPNYWYPGYQGAIYADVAANANFQNLWDSKTFDPGDPGSSGNAYFDPASFSNPPGHNLGNGKRLYEELRGFGYANEDIGIMKYWHFTESSNLQFRAEMLDVFNRHHYDNPHIDIGDATTFGKVTSTTGEARVIQLGLRFQW